ncbi:GRRM system radical SAM/SPASM domain protein [Actinocorallia aurea]
MSRQLYDQYVNPTFANVMMQPTTRCTADCLYCYLPGRDKDNRMLPEVARAVAASIRQQNADHPVTVIWHGGEPLALPLDRFEQLLEPFEELRREGKVIHSLQTNATLITAAWCDLFRRYEVSVGVSVDGPQDANHNRVNWAGRPIFDQVMRGIGVLREEGIVFTSICVVTPDTVQRPGELLDFFDELGGFQVGFNIEEKEGANLSRPGVDHAAVVEFWKAAIEHQKAGRGVKVREIQILADYLALARTGRKNVWIEARHEPGPAVSWDGQVVLLSPEFLGCSHPGYGDFVVGIVTAEPLPAMLARAHEVAYVAEFMDGLAACEAVCPFWSMCRGAQPANRLFENGSFTSTETLHCRNTRQAPVVALAATVS